jgi:hypothetical protein
MVWYNPFSWFGNDANAAPQPPTPAPTPLAGDMPTTPAAPAPTYGGRHRKGRKHRKTYRGGKKHRSKTGRRKH